MKVIGLSGGIGSGKSTVAYYLSTLGIPVFSADAAVRTAVKKGSPCLPEIVALLGTDCLLEDGEITPRVYYEMYHVAINAHAACQGFDRQIRWLEGHTVSEKWGIQADYYEDDGKEMYYIDQCFISHFDGADGNWWSHAYFNDVYGKDAEDVTWEDVLLEREES